MSLPELALILAGLVLYSFGIYIGEKLNRTKKYSGRQKFVMYFGILLIIILIIFITYFIEHIVSKIICFIFINFLLFWLLAGGIIIGLIIQRKKRKSNENIADDYLLLDVLDKELFKEKNKINNV